MPERSAGFALPEAVGIPLTKEELSRIVQDSCVEMAARLRFARMVAISYAPAERMLRVVTLVGFSMEAPQLVSAPVDECPCVRQALDSGEIVISEGARGCMPTPLVPHFRGAVAVVPMLLGERRVAVLCGQAQPGVSFLNPTWRAAAEEIAEKAALVAECERLQSAYQELFHQQMRTRDIAAAILQQRALPDILELITRHVVDRFDVDRLGIYLMGETGVEAAHLHNIPADYAVAVARFATVSPLVQAARSSLVPFVMEHVDQRSDFAPMAELFAREGIHTLAVAPLQFGQTVQGALVLYPRHKRRFTPLDMSALKLFADQTALAIAVTRFLEEQRDTARVHERNRLARELHDTLAQALTAIVIQLEAAEHTLESGHPARELVVETRVLARAALEDTRRSVMGLAPTPLERLSLSEALAQETESFAKQSGIRTLFVPTGTERPLTDEQKTALFRIAQESLHNARKHAQANRIRVALSFGPNSVTLTVEDDGVGFDTSVPRAPGAEGGFGLFGMQERARLQGGEVRIESTIGWGTRITAILPYDPATGPAKEAMPKDAWQEPSRSAMSTGLPHEPAIRVLIADDHALARQGIGRMLEAEGGFTIVGEAADGFETLEKVQQLSPDVLLLDLQMPRMTGLQALQRLQTDHPDLPVIILTTFDSQGTLLEAIRSGAKGYLLKDSAASELAAAIRAAHRGESLLQPAMTTKLLERLREDRGADFRSAELNEREKEVLQLLVTGARNKEIAAKLFITDKTVESHLSHIFSKLGVSNRTEAVRYAIEHGLVSKDT